MIENIIVVVSWLACITAICGAVSSIRSARAARDEATASARQAAIEGRLMLDRIKEMREGR